MPSYLGIDIGGTKVAFRAESEERAFYEATFTWPRSGCAADDLSALAANACSFADKWGQPITAVGVAVPATLDDAGAVVSWPSRATWAGLDLGASLRSMFPGAGVSCADDGDVAAIAEAAEAKCQHLAYLGVGTGIGGGIVHEGRSCPGLARGSCEIGHMIIDRSGPRCACGRRGCLQALASGPATLRRAAELRGSAVTFPELKAASQQGLSWAVAAVAESCAALGAAVISLGELLRPSLTVIGGGFAAGLPGFVSAVSRHAASTSRPGQAPLPVRPAALGGLSSLHGAVLLARGI